MQDKVSAIMLAGTILPTPFQEALGLPMLCLPIGPTGSVLDAWRYALGQVDELSNAQLVVKSPSELENVTAVVHSGARDGSGPVIDVLREPGAWRGVAGLLHDLTEDIDEHGIVLVCEAHCHPPKSLKPLLDAMTADTIGVVGTTNRGEPAGVYAFRRSAFKGVSHIGYCDLKEQLLPMLYERKQKVVSQPVAERVQRMRDLDTYLTVVQSSLQPGSADSVPLKRVSPRAQVSATAMLEGFCIIEPGAIIEDGVVLHNSVVLSGGIVSGGAVVSRSVIGPRVRVQPRTQVVHDVLSTPAGVIDEVLKLMEAEASSPSAA